jgi:uncharacterized membrane protein
MNPLNTVKGSIATGLVLAVVIAGILSGTVSFNHLAFTRWLHLVAGVMWIGLLYYFNVVQVPGLAAAAADTGGPGGAGISKYIAPRALLWFRWAAVVTWVSGAAYLAHTGVLLKAFTLAEGSRVIGVGAWLGSIMLFNVWVLIWPNQKKALGIVQATDAEKATARRIALLASRANFLLSIPMLMCMGGQNHGLPF